MIESEDGAKVKVKICRPAGRRINYCYFKQNMRKRNFLSNKHARINIYPCPIYLNSKGEKVELSDKWMIGNIGKDDFEAYYPSYLLNITFGFDYVREWLTDNTHSSIGIKSGILRLKVHTIISPKGVSFEPI